MKKYPLLFLFSSVTLLSYGQSQKLILETDFTQEEISYCTLNGGQLPFYDLASTVHPNLDKMTEIDLIHDQSVYKVVIDRKSFKIYSTANSVDTVYLYNDSLSFCGNNKLYNLYLIKAEESDKYCRNYSRDHELSSVHELSDFKAKIFVLKQNDNQLLDNSLLSDEFVKQQKHFTDLRYYALFLKKMESLHKASPLTDDWINEFKNINFPLDTDISLQSDWFYPILEDYVYIKSFILEGIKPEDVMSLFNTFLFDNYSKILDEKKLEYALACLLYNDIFQENYSKDIPSLYNRFTALFPDSPYIGLLESGVKKTADLHKQEANNDKIVLLNYETAPINFEEMTRPFLGKVVYIDVWATWCGPCLKSFSEVGNIKEKLGYLDGVEIFYISVDQDRNHEKWQKLINYYNLEGYHYRVNKHTSEIVYGALGNSKGMLSIPRYIIVDKNGKIAFFNAASPSAINELTEQLKSLLQ